VNLRSDARDEVKAMIRSEVDKRDGFSSPEEERANLNAVEGEKERQDSAYKNAVAAGNKEFVLAKKRRDDVTTQFQAVSTDLEEQQKEIKTIRTGIENLDSQAARYTQDIKTQQDALKKWLQMEKQGEALVAVIFTQGFKDTAHTLESLSDQASAPLMAEYMGTYVESFTKVVNSVLSVDFIRTREEGTAKWNNEEPLRMELEKGNRGTTYLRLKRYELYPFQAPKGGKAKPDSASKNIQAAVITAKKGLDDFLAKNGYSAAKYDLGRAYGMVQETAQMNATAADGLREQVRSFQSRIYSLQQRLTANAAEKEAQLSLLKKKEAPYMMAAQDVAGVQRKKEEADRAFQAAQKSLHDVRRVRDSIIVKTSLASPRGSQSPAEASAEAIIDKLAEVKNDAKMQHSSSTVEVTNFQLTGESSIQAVTEARITAVRLMAFINEGDSVRVKMAFRVRTALEEPGEKEPGVTTQMAGKTPAVKPLFTPDAQSTQPAEEGKKTARVQEPAKSAPVIPPLKRNPNALGSAEANEALFEVTSVKLSGDVITVLVEVTNLTDDSNRTVAIYDEAYRWTKSRLTDTAGQEYEVTQVVFWKGQQKTSMYDAGTRGVIMDAKKPQTAQLIFKKVPSDLKVIKTLTIHPFIYFRRTWQEHDLVFENIGVSR
jgi:hypothetical protein